MSERDDFREVYRQHQDSGRRYTYFLLAVAGAAIAFVTTQTREAIPGWQHLVLAAGVALWGFSFYAGCRYTTLGRGGLLGNLEIMKAQLGEHSVVGRNPVSIRAASQVFSEELEDNNKRANWWAKMQLRSFIFGSLLYVVWHIWEMFLNTPSVSGAT